MGKVWKGFGVITGVINIVLCVSMLRNWNGYDTLLWIAILVGYPLFAYSIGVLLDKTDKTNQELSIMNKNLGELVALYKKNTTSVHNKGDFESDKKLDESNMILEDNSKEDEKVHPIETSLENTIICPNCKAKQPANRTVCWECGSKFEK